MGSRYKSILLIIGLYLAIIGVYCFVHYKNMRSELIEGIDHKLITAAYATQAILGPNFHDKLVDKNSISAEEDYQLGIKLYQFAKNINVEYVYSLKKFNGEILFVVSSATDDELALDTYQPAYFTQYPEMDGDIERAFQTQKRQTAEYHDRWGSFRSVFMPFKTQSGEVYVIGADVSIRAVNLAVFKSVSYTLLMACFLGFLITPIIILLIKSVQRQWRIKYQSMFYDELTGLPNQNQLMQDLNKSDDTHLAIIDIRKFCDVIALHGPAIGDHLLKQFGCRLNNFVHPKLKNFKAYRLGGDVFATLEDQALDDKVANAGAQEMINFIVEYQYRLTSSEFIKLNITLGGVNQSEDAFMLANMALAEAKRKNIQSFVYDKNSTYLPEIYKKNALIQKQLQAALDEDRLVPFFQPIVDVADLNIVKYECLARVLNSHGDIELTPDIFLPVARQTRLYEKVTQHIVTKSIATAQKYNCVISMNLCISDIMNGSTRHFIFEAVKKSAIAHQIEFEILETEAIHDYQKVRKFIQKLQSLGVKVGIDDMGRSHSNFDRLTILPVDFIKIDGSVITLIEHDNEAQALTRNTVKLAHRHKLKVTAEYCHNEAVTQMAMKLGVDYLQGFYLGQPSQNIQQSVDIPQLFSQSSV